VWQYRILNKNLYCTIKKKSIYQSDFITLLLLNWYCLKTFFATILRKHLITIVNQYVNQYLFRFNTLDILIMFMYVGISFILKL